MTTTGTTTTKAVSWLLTTEARIQPGASPCGIYNGYRHCDRYFS